MSAPLVLLLADCHDASLVGGKALNLGRLTNAGFRVPEGFVVTTEAFRQSGGIELSEETRRQVVETYRKLGSPLVAVRSSATAEDMAEASMAGQYETFLNIQGENEVLDAVARCWKSLNTARTRSYLEEHGIAMDQVAMAVVVQRLVSAEVAGVLFTANPRNGSREEMVVDASYGLGESVVSGLVQPDSLVLDRTTGRVKEAVCGSKETWLRTGARESEPVNESLRGRPCLNSEQVRELWRLGLKLADHFGSAQDAEWAFDADRLYLLQSRAITTLEEIEARAECLHLTRAQLRESLAAGHGAWVRHNICETLPHPTQLTWSVVKRFMSGAGGFGGMYRMAGFEPSASASENGFLDLIAGRIYMDLSRGPEMFFEDMPFRYDIQLLRVSPDAAAGAPTIPFGSPLQQWKVASKLAGTTAKLRGLADDFDRRFEAQILPDFVGWVREEKPRDLSALTVAEWIALWSERERRVMDDFAPASLLPSLITAMALDDLKVFCAENFWDEDPEALASGLSASPKPDSTVRSAEGLHRIVHGSSTVEAWIEEFGHRAPEEFDLATPRWRERPDAVATLAGHLAGSESPLARQEQRLAEADELFQSLEKRLPNHLKPALRKHVDLSRRYLRYREDGKYFLMLGYDLLRDLAIEAGRRLGIGARVFLMDLEELRDALLTGFAPLHLLDKRGVARSAESRLILPHVVDEGDIEGLGEPPPVEGGDRMQAFSISNGVATGPAKIVFSPAEAGDLGEGYILVCPSTDPNWTPLFVKAAGLVIERGGTLSHGAVVAREMGLPAVVFDGATRAFKDGELITVDAQRGAIMRSAGLADGGTPADIEADASDEKIAPAAMPPPPGDFDRKSAGVRNFWLALWAVYFVGAFLCPAQWIYDPSLRLLDFVFWPLVEHFGKPVTVAILAAGLAAVCMIGQRLLTDNRRLDEAKKRAASLQKEAKKLPPDSPRNKALLRSSAPVQTRIMLASFVPLAVILGPMVMIFSWLPVRVDPASANARPGADILVTAKVAGDFTKPVRIEAEPPLTLADGEDAAKTLPPIRATLEKLQAKWRVSTTPPPGLPWDILAAGARARENMLADLGAYLKSPLPPQELAWTIKSPTDKAGRFGISILADESASLKTVAVLGDRFPPENREDLGDKKGPVQTVHTSSPESPVSVLRIQYRQQKVAGEGAFWRPFKSFGSEWDPGWLLAYIAAYIPVMVFFRWLLRIP